MKCTRCGKDNPADIHTCFPLALKLAEEIDAIPDTGADPDMLNEAAAELRRLHDVIEALKHALHTEESVSFRKQLTEVQAENEALREALEKLSRLGNGDQYGNSIGNEIARAALARVGEKT